MNRIDDLTDRLIDGALGEADVAELAALLDADPAARARHLALLDVEAALRGLRTDLDLGAATVARIEGERAERAVSAVMAGIAAAPPPPGAAPAAGLRSPPRSPRSPPPFSCRCCSSPRRRTRPNSPRRRSSPASRACPAPSKFSARTG